MKEQQWGRGRGAVSDTRAKHYIRTQGIKIGHRGSAIRRESVTEGCDRGASRGVSEGSKGASWMLAVTEPRDETRRGGGGVDAGLEATNKQAIAGAFPKTRGRTRP